MAASADEHSWILEGGSVDVHLVRRVAYDMILPFRWSWGWPRGNWSWTSVWLLDVEADMILSQAMSGFISAEPDDIIEAARIWKLDADAAPAGDDKLADDHRASWPAKARKRLDLSRVTVSPCECKL